MKIGVIGAGKWGMALRYALSKNHEVYISSRTARDIENFISLQEMLKLKYLVITIPSQEISRWLDEYFIFNNQNIMVASKGIEADSLKFLNEIYAKYVPCENICFLSGPSFATEVMQSLPTALVVNSSNKQLADKFGSFFPDFIKAYSCDDVMGAEIAGAYKNVIAIAAGICEGLGLGKNAAASLVSRGLVEMQRFGLSFGAKSDSFVGLSGAGDLFLSASSPMSRNFRVGLGLALGKTIDVILKELQEVAEGIKTADAIYKISLQRNLYLPIATEVYHILHGKDPKQSLKDLLSS